MRWATIRTEAGTRAVARRRRLARRARRRATSVSCSPRRRSARDRARPTTSRPPTTRRSSPHPARSSARDSTTGATSSRWDTSSPSTPRCSPSSARRSSARTTTSSLPPDSDSVDWEAELALVIGARAPRASPHGSRGRDRRLHRRQRRLDARLAVPHARVAAGQDLGARHAGRPLAGDPRRGRRHRARPRDRLRGRRRRPSGEPHRRSSCSRPPTSSPTSASSCTLEPGDLLLTGTPAGVGHGMDPPVYLAAGQVVRTTHRGPRRAPQPLRGRAPAEPRQFVPIVTSSPAGRTAETSVVPRTPQELKTEDLGAPRASRPRARRARTNVTWPRPRGMSRRDLQAAERGAEAPLERRAPSGRRRAGRRPRCPRRRRLRGRAGAGVRSSSGSTTSSVTIPTAGTTSRSVETSRRRCR